MNAFLESLLRYKQICESLNGDPVAREQSALVDRFAGLVEKGRRCLYRDNWEGHLTGSALLTNREKNQVLLTLHAKLEVWVQLGGHADGDGDIAAVALRECQEESGIELVDFVSPDIFDLDIHWIPERKTEPGHFHFDVRYLMQTDSHHAPVLSDESKDLRWMILNDAYACSSEPSMHRQFDKLRNSIF